MIASVFARLAGHWIPFPCSIEESRYFARAKELSFRAVKGEPPASVGSFGRDLDPD
jgi:hypothetical protein